MRDAGVSQGGQTGSSASGLGRGTIRTRGGVGTLGPLLVAIEALQIAMSYGIEDGRDFRVEDSGQEIGDVDSMAEGDVDG